MSLKEYKARRNFGRTREPAGRSRAPAQTEQSAFVVQKHDATRLHFDFRLEMDGVLKSWAVPKGFPSRRGERRLAVQVEDHPVEYADFEGTIPQGNYGAGTVMVWDNGTYQVSGDDPRRALEEGKLHFTLHGRKLKGDWTLVRMCGSEDKPQWLLLKSGEDAPELSKRAETTSVLTKRTLEQIAAAADRQWESHHLPDGRTPEAANRTKPRRPAKTRAQTRWSKSLSNRSEPSSVPIQLNHLRLPPAKPGFFEPMKALLADRLPRGPQWIYEIKFDGVRALAAKNQREVTLTSRNGKELRLKYPQIAQALLQLPARNATLDGEIVAVDPQGRPSFQLLQSYAMGTEKPPLLYYVFDLVSLEGKDLTGLSLWQRKGAAEMLVKAADSPVIRFSAGINAECARVMREMQARGLEGLIAKKKDSKYQPGRRSGAWLKFKWSNEQEFVIGGFTKPKGARHHFGALLVGYYEDDELRFAGKVGTGFDEKALSALRAKFESLIRPSCPFSNLPERLRAARGGLTASQMRLCTWLEPKLVCRVRFAEWTRDLHLRQPAYLGLREDKKARQVVREQPRTV